MKLTILTALLLLTPALALSAPNLAERLEGKILLAVEDHGKTYYIQDGKRYRVTKDTAHAIFEKLALGIADKDLKEIPEGSVGIEPESELACEPIEPAECNYEAKDATIELLNTKISFLEAKIAQSEVNQEEKEEEDSKYSSFKPTIQIIDRTKQSKVLYITNSTNRNIRIQKMEVHIPIQDLYPTINWNYVNTGGGTPLEHLENGIYVYTGDIIFNSSAQLQIFGTEDMEIDLSKWIIWDYTENKQVRL